jgi:hypothetical protein
MSIPARALATILAGLSLATTASLAADPPVAPAATPELARWAETRDARMAWWRGARFGMFIHWGLYSPAGGFWDGKRYEQHYAEWIQHWAAVPCAEYARRMKPLFAPEPGFADAWADLARDAGMRYAVLTSKHHDGFTLFNSKAPYSLANPITGGTNISPPGRDVAREFADAMRSRGLRAGFYYSLLDWQHPDAYEMALPAYPRGPRPRRTSTTSAPTSTSCCRATARSRRSGSTTPTARGTARRGGRRGCSRNCARNSPRSWSTIGCTRVSRTGTATTARRRSTYRRPACPAWTGR